MSKVTQPAGGTAGLLEPTLSNSGAPPKPTPLPAALGRLSPWAFLGRGPPLLQQLLKCRSCALHPKSLGSGAERPVACLPVVTQQAGGSEKQTLRLAVSAPRSETRPGSRPPCTLEPKPLPLRNSSHGGLGLHPQQASERPSPLRAGAGRGPHAPQRPGGPWGHQGRPPTPQEAGSLRHYPQQSQEAPFLASSGCKGAQPGGRQHGGSGPCSAFP